MTTRCIRPCETCGRATDHQLGAWPFCRPCTDALISDLIDRFTGKPLKRKRLLPLTEPDIWEDR